MSDSIPSKSGKSKTGRLIAWLHLWPGLVSAILLVFVCLTGTIIVYCDEIIDLVNRDVLFVSKTAKEKIPAEQLINGYRKAFPRRNNPGYMVFYRDPARSVKLRSFEPGKGPSLVYMDPYTGKILKDDPTIYFFHVAACLHSSLLWPGPGNWIIDIATLVFLVELITGLVLWWPSKWTRTTRRASFTIKWRARFRRLNYDLHNVPAFYTLSICLVLTLTGLLIAFKPLARLTMDAFGGDPGPGWEKQLPAFEENRMHFPMNAVVDRLFSQFPDKEAIQVMTCLPDTVGYYRVNVARRIGMRSCESCDAYTIDKYSGGPADLPEAVMEHENIENGYRALHMGTWMGQFGKFVTFTGGLVATSLPVTGFLIWWGKRKKNGTSRTLSLNLRPLQKRRT